MVLCQLHFPINIIYSKGINSGPFRGRFRMELNVALWPVIPLAGLNNDHYLGRDERRVTVPNRTFLG